MTAELSLRDEYVAAIEAENDALRARVALLEEAVGLRIEVPLEFGLTAQESAVFGLLLKREIVTKDMAMLGLYGARPDGDAAEPKIIDVFICKMRGKLKLFGIPIETVWGRGYRMTADAKRAALALLPDSGSPTSEQSETRAGGLRQLHGA